LKHATIPVFVPHLACRNSCVFCNQRRISGTESPLSDPEPFLEKAAEELSDRFDSADIAFFGGSFTGIEEEKQKIYLSAAKNVRLRHPAITGIRVSTRPDYISEKSLELLLSYGVTTVELGAQSFDNGVLRISKRGHTAEDTEKACALIKAKGLRLGLQIMPGLPGDTRETILKTIEKTAELMPDDVRIYPCVVVKETELEEMFLENLFTPLSTEEAAEYSAYAVSLFGGLGINVVRTGLHGSDLESSGSIVAGPYHPAFGELVLQRIYFEKAVSVLSEAKAKGLLKKEETLLVGKGKISCAVGQKRKNVEALRETFGIGIRIREKEGIDDLCIERMT